MSHQPRIDMLLKRVKKRSSSKQAFERQYAEISQSESHKENCCNHLEKVTKLEREKEEQRGANHVLEIQLKSMTEKYEKLKVKHVSLLQTLFAKENEIQKLKFKLNSDAKIQLVPDLSCDFVNSKIKLDTEAALQNVISKYYLL